MSDTPYELVAATDIPARLVQDISAATSSVHLQSMNFESMGTMTPVIEAAIDAARRGVIVTLAFDKLALTERRGGQLRTTVGLLQQAGVSVKLLGKSLIPLKVAGRSHTKVYLIDDISYFGGGVNLTDKSFSHHDFMLRYVDNMALHDALEQLIKRQPIDDADWHVQFGNDKLLVDGGKRGNSLIYDEAVHLAESATRAWYISQFAPGHELERALCTLPAERRGSWFNTVRSSQVRQKPAALIDGLVSKLMNAYQGTRRIHAKFLVVQKSDGTYAAVTGSHNFSDWGIRFGTKEAALMTTDQALCRQLVQFAESLEH